MKEGKERGLISGSTDKMKSAGEESVLEAEKG